MRRVLLVALFFSAACATVRPTPSQQLAALVDEHWQRQLARDVGTRAELGLPIETLPNFSFAQEQRDTEFSRGLLARLERIDASRLSADEWLSLRILEHLHRQQLTLAPHFWLRFQLTPYASPIRPVLNVLNALPPETAAELTDEYARFIDGLTEVVKEQERRGIRIPKRELGAVRGLIAGAAPRSMKSEAIDAAVTRLAAVFSPAYEAAAPEAIGIGHYQGGAEAYRALIRVHTSYDLDPRELHDFGLRELARIDRQLADVRAQLGFTGAPRDFYPFLQQYWTERGAFRDPQAHFTAYVRRIEPHVSRFFKVTPRAPYDTRRLDPALEAAMTFGYYQRPTSTDATGHYYFNGSPSKPRSIIFGGALMAHELVPGHHFQIARQIEAEHVPLFRRQRYDTAFVEGWGEYSAVLASEMGLYETPHDLAGRLMMDALVSTRLVVDTGLNAFGWTYEQAAEFMRAHTPLTDEEIATEILRYAVDIPGQALAYKVGSMKMIELRQKAMDAAAPHGDVAHFHEQVLRNGSMPLSILEEHLRRTAVR
ncbi:MAG TPA: DUF885 domain-containing protein [Thermoanaerobaculia bacterium]|nr:DUF885 domain-containing protein [Thermoanaerobaculia bacterium]